jgi:hypothetical protein
VEGVGSSVDGHFLCASHVVDLGGLIALTFSGQTHFFFDDLLEFKVTEKKRREKKRASEYEREERRRRVRRMKS